MKLLDRLFGRKAAQLTYDQIADLIDGVGGARVAGVHVTEKTALQVSTVLACVKTIADGCATPELHVFRERDDGRPGDAAGGAGLHARLLAIDMEAHAKLPS